MEAVEVVEVTAVGVEVALLELERGWK